MTALTPAAPTGILAANLICMASMLVWAAGLPAADVLIPLIPPIPLATLRLALAAAVMLPLWWLVDGGRVVLGAHWGRGLAVGGICLGIGSMLLIYAQSQTGAVTVAVISAMAPVAGIALEALLDGRKITLRLVLGLFLSLAGGLCAYAAAMGDLALGLGALAALSSVIAYTWGSRATVTAFPGLTPLGRTAITVTGAAATAAAAALAHTALGGASPDWAAIGWTELGALALFGIGGMALSQLFWIMSVGRIGIAMSTLHLNAAPFYVMIFLYALGGTWNWTQALGAAVVGIGVLVAQGLIPLPHFRH